jgi:arylsulfatase
VLEVAGLPQPTFVNGVAQMSIHGVGMAYSFDAGAAAERRELQYFEMVGNRGVYHQGWTAVTKHATPWVAGGELPAFDDDVWELYAPEDWTQARDLSAEMPEKLHELQRLFLIEAVKYSVLPLDDRRVERLSPEIAGRPVLIKGNRQLLFSGMGRLTEATVVNIKNKSHAVTAQLTIPASGGEGVVVAQGGSFGGWSLYLKHGQPVYCYNLLGLEHTKVAGDEPVEAGEHQVRMEFTYDGGGLGQGGVVSLYLDGSKVGEGRLERTQPFLFSMDETTDIGRDSATPVSDDHGAGDSAFTGRIDWVEIDVDAAAADVDHLIGPEERLRIAMARQ